MIASRLRRVSLLPKRLWRRRTISVRCLLGIIWVLAALTVGVRGAMQLLSDSAPPVIRVLQPSGVPCEVYGAYKLGGKTILFQAERGSNTHRVLFDLGAQHPVDIVFSNGAERWAALTKKTRSFSADGVFRGPSRFPVRRRLTLPSIGT